MGKASRAIARGNPPRFGGRGEQGKRETGVSHVARARNLLIIPGADSSGRYIPDSFQPAQRLN